MPSLQPNSTILIDGNAYLYRFYHGSEPRFRGNGEPTHVIYSYMMFLRTCLFRYKPERLIVVFDAPGTNFRHQLYAAYKAHRHTMPDDLRSQIEPVKRAITLLGIPVIEIPNVEADDSLATLALNYAKKGDMNYIFSLDKDLTQLISDKVHIVHDRKKLILDADFIKNKYGVYPDQIIDLLALTGDDADNIPGVEGVGLKTAAKFLQTWGTLENIIANAHWVKGKVGDNLRKSIDKLLLSKQLTTIKLDVPLSLGPNEAELTPEDKAGIRKFCDEYEFK
ncbi:MAG: hypothetical protein COA74_13355 [Gammaproteobacteria bacterium]|nr:MAG: hypothetical protein COA74_13355 [Gammaproteobacteria bacterium]